MQGNSRIAEDPRGVFDTQQNLEPNMVEILEEKLKDFGSEADRFKKKSADMKQLTAIENRVKRGEKLTKDDLLFVYEINSPIESFGYKRDPRIAELRNPKEDMPIFFECTQRQIANTPRAIRKNTKAYVGPIVRIVDNKDTGQKEVAPEYKNIFKKLAHVEYILTAFPEKNISRQNIEIGGKTTQQLFDEMERHGIKLFGIHDWTKNMLLSGSFTPSKNFETLTIVTLTVESLGFGSSSVYGATVEDVLQRAEELGLELCPAEIAPYYRLKYQDQPVDDTVAVGMKPIIHDEDMSSIFDIYRNTKGVLELSLEPSSPQPGVKFILNGTKKFIFRMPAT